MAYGIEIHAPEIPIAEQWLWETDLSTSYNGAEDRIPLLRYPRRSFSGNFVFTDKADLRRYLAMATKRFRTEFQFPLFQYGTKLKAATVALSDTVFVNAKRSNLRVGSPALIMEGGKFEQVQVLAVTKNSVQFVAALANSYTKRAMLYPLSTVYSQTGATVDRMNPDHAGKASFTFFERMPTIPFVSPLNEAVLLEFENMPILPFAPVGTEFNSAVQTGVTVENYLAIDDFVSPWTFEQWTYAATFNISHIVPTFDIDLAKSFPGLNKGQPGYPEPGTAYPNTVRVGPFDTNVRIVSGDKFGQNPCRADDFFLFSGVQYDVTPSVTYPAGTILYELPAGSKMTIGILNTLDSHAGVDGAVSILPVPNWEWWEKFADRIQGSSEPFLFPTNRSDFDLVTPAVPGGAALTVRGDEYTQHYWGHGGFSRIFIDSDAGWHFAKVTAISAVAGNDRLTFQPALPAGADWSKNQRVGFLLKVRLDDDKIALNHYGLNSEVSIALRTVV